MLRSSSFTNNNTSPILYVDNILSYLLDDLNPNSKQEDPTTYSTSYYHLPSPLIYNEIDDFVSNHDLEFIQQALNANNSNNSFNFTDDSSILDVDNKVVDGSNKGDEINGIVEDGEMNHTIISSTKKSSTRNNNGGLKKKRASNKDRHSKIRTAHGLRDRRMRLSLQVARPFFKLQDMLGYDKASRTVEWLLLQSKSAIEEILHSKSTSPSGVTKCTISSTSDDCEVESTIIEEMKEDRKEKRASTCVTKKDEVKQKRKRTTKEERKVARERAKKRTLERMQSRGRVTGEGSNNFVLDDFDLTENWNPLTTFSYQQSFEDCQTGKHSIYNTYL